MKLIEAVEEIQEKVQSSYTLDSIVRKINFVRDQIIRKYESRVVMSQLDIIEGLPTYPLPLPVDTIRAVLVDGIRYNLGQFDNYTVNAMYYYLLDGVIGIHPRPKEDKEKGLTIFHNKHLKRLTSDNLDVEIGIDQDYDMLVVYGALRDMTSGNDYQEYSRKFENLLSEFLSATGNKEPEFYQIRSEGWIG